MNGSSRAVASFLTFVLLTGVLPHEAAAQLARVAVGAASHGPAVNVAPIAPPDGVGMLPTVMSLAPALNSSFGVPSAPDAASVLPSLPASLLPIPVASVAGTPVRAAANDSNEKAVRDRNELTRVVQNLDAARGEAAKTGVLDNLFTGMRRNLSRVEFAPERSASRPDAASAPPIRLEGPGLLANDTPLTTAAPKPVEDRQNDDRIETKGDLHLGRPTLRPAAVAALGIVAVALGVTAISIIWNPAMLSIPAGPGEMILRFVIAPIAEEALFRGGLMGGLMWLGSKAGLKGFALFVGPALINGIVFGACHWHIYPNIAVVALIALEGVAWSVLRFRVGLAASVTMHSVSNILNSSFMGIFGVGFTLAGVFIWLGIEVEGMEGKGKFKGWPDFWSSKKGRVSGTTAAILFAILLTAITLIREFFDPLGWLIYGGGALGLAVYAALKGLIWVRQRRAS